ncbi:TPA: amino acid decarboxylase [Streptococcus suis]|nr:amino acid decarboxylase [Streptococcus suis]
MNLNDFLKKLDSIASSDCMIYNLDLLESLINRLKKDFPSCTLLYAMKANSNEKILELIARLNMGVDCASYEEFDSAKKNKFKMISCTGSGFKIDEINKILSNGFTFDFDNVSQLELYVDKYGQITSSKGIRISCDNSHLGFSIEEIIKYNYLLEGLSRIHIHFGQKNIENIRENLDYLKKIIKNNFSIFQNISQINFGGSIEDLYIKGHQNLASSIFNNFKIEIETFLDREIEILLEPGDFLARPIGFYKTSILYSRQRNITLNSSILNFCPWYPKNIAIPSALTGSNYIYTVSGNSCFEYDLFGTVETDRKLSKKDVAIIYPVGSYNFNMNRFIHDRKVKNTTIYYYRGEFFE